MSYRKMTPADIDTLVIEVREVWTDSGIYLYLLATAPDGSRWQGVDDWASYTLYDGDGCPHIHAHEAREAADRALARTAPEDCLHWIPADPVYGSDVWDSNAERRQSELDTY